MNKPRLLYASPFPPKQSGISDYSVVLVDALSKYFDITLFIDDYSITEESLKVYDVVRYGIDYIDYDSFDYIIYNIGNQPDFHSYIYETALKHPGLIILHDMVVYYLFVGYYQRKGELYSAVYSKQGLDDFLTVKRAVKKDGPALLEQKHMASLLPFNKEILNSGNRIMVHSEYAKKHILDMGYIQPENIVHINHLSLVDESESFIDKKTLFKKYGVPEDAIVISSFGFIAETKMNYEVCVAIKELSKTIGRKLCYVMVGEGSYVDDQLEKGLIIKTGYTELQEFNSFIYHSDIVINLRNPSMGETSGAMIRILQMGKPCITNNGGWFSELPDECVRKVDVNNIQSELENAIMDLVSDDDDREQLGNAAQRYIEDNYRGNIIAEQIYDFMTKK